MKAAAKKLSLQQYYVRKLKMSFSTSLEFIFKKNYIFGCNFTTSTSDWICIFVCFKWVGKMYQLNLHDNIKCEQTDTKLRCCFLLAVLLSVTFNFHYKNKASFKAPTTLNIKINIMIDTILHS